MGSVVLHIGFPKTATTTLQTTMERVPGVAYLGKGIRDTMQPSLSLEIARAVFFADTRRFEELAPGIAAAIAAEAEGADCLFLSDEAFTFAEHMEIGGRWGRATVTDHEVVAERLHRLMPAGTQVMMSVREQVAFLQSWYRQTLKRGTVEADGFAAFVDAEIAALAHRSVLHALRYDEARAAYADRFGADAVHVAAFEASRGDLGVHLDEVAAVAGLDPAALRDTWGGRHANPDRPRRQPASVRRLRSLVPAPLGALLPKRLKRAVFERTALPPPALAVSQAASARLAAEFAAPNRRLAEATGLDLAAWGYTLG